MRSALQQRRSLCRTCRTCWMWISLLTLLLCAWFGCFLPTPVSPFSPKDLDEELGRNSLSPRIDHSLTPMGRHLQMDWQTETQVVNKRYRLLGKQAAWKRLKAIRNARLARRSTFCVSGKSSQQIASTASRGPMGCSRFWFLLGTFLNHPVVQFGRLWFSGNCQYSLGTTVLNFICKLGNWNPWNAQRVGEASNPGPGPGGSRSTERKRKEQTASQEADVSLATELLRAMEKFQSRGDEQGISAPPKKRARVAILCHSPSLTWPLL